MLRTAPKIRVIFLSLLKETALQTRNKQGLTSLKAGDSLDHSGFLHLKKKKQFHVPLLKTSTDVYRIRSVTQSGGNSI